MRPSRFFSMDQPLVYGYCALALVGCSAASPAPVPAPAVRCDWTRDAPIGELRTTPSVCHYAVYDVRPRAGIIEVILNPDNCSALIRPLGVGRAEVRWWSRVDPAPESPPDAIWCVDVTPPRSR
jgi:hypothetical protein